MLRKTFHAQAILASIAIGAAATAFADDPRHREQEQSRQSVDQGFAWDDLGLKLEETDPTVIENVNRLRSTKYRGAMLVTAVRHDGPADRAKMRVGDLLLGIHGWQTINQKDIHGIAARKPTLLDAKSVKFYVVRDGETRFGRLSFAKSE